MRYSIKSHSCFLELAIRGKFEYWDFLDYPEMIKAELDNHPRSLLLLDLNDIQGSRFGELELLFLSEEFLYQVRSGCFIAVHRENLYNRELQAYFMADNNARMRIFETRPEAISWLNTIC